MKAILLFFLFIFTPNTFSQNVSPEFSELKGMEDQNGNTHLFYRIHTYFANDPIFEWTNHIYHLDKTSGIDTLFITASGMESPTYNNNRWVSDVDYWNNNPNQFIYCGGITSGQFFEGSAYIQRVDGFNNYFGLFWGTANYIDISISDDSTLYAGIITDGGLGVLKSINGGRSWDSLSTTYQFLSLNPSYENIYFVEDENRRLFRTTDAGNTFNLVDPEFLPDTRFYYDQNSQYIYRKAYHKLIVSDNLGEQFSWETKYTSAPGEEFYISVDYSISGTLYLANKKNIYLSTDYGDNFSLYKSLERNIVGIYKKPNSDKLYAATKYKIYEITPDTTQVIKSLPIPDELLSYYPLTIGNKWVYDTYGWWADTAYHTYSGITFREVISDTVMANGQFYYKLFDPTTFNFPSLLFERIDTASGKVFRYDHTLGLPNDEYLIDDLFAEVGDTIWSSRHQYQDFFPFICVDESAFNKWGIQAPRKIFTIFDLTGYTYSLTQGLGIDSIYSSFDFGENFAILKGCIIDGIVYGDTTVVSVEDETPDLPKEFYLSQNYPNPFNPITTIKWQQPKADFISLKIYDVLGNEIVTLVDEYKTAGTYEVEFSGKGLTSGVYFYQLKAENFIQTKKMILMK